MTLATQKKLEQSITFIIVATSTVGCVVGSLVVGLTWSYENIPSIIALSGALALIGLFVAFFVLSPLMTPIRKAAGVLAATAFWCDSAIRLAASMPRHLDRPALNWLHRMGDILP